jgi:hypothetical protein
MIIFTSTGTGIFINMTFFIYSPIKCLYRGLLVLFYTGLWIQIVSGFNDLRASGFGIRIQGKLNNVQTTGTGILFRTYFSILLQKGLFRTRIKSIRNHNPGVKK